MEPKKLSEQELAEIRTRFANRFYRQDVEAVTDHVGWLLAHIAAMEAEHSARFQMLEAAYGEAAEALQKKDARISQLVDALKEARERLELEGVEYQSIDEVLKANGPG